MAQDFENIVRPFQLQDGTTPQPYVSQGQSSRSPIAVIIGRTVAQKGLRMFNYSYKAVYTFYMDMSVVEQTKKADDGTTSP